MDKILKKMGEECAETIIAAKNGKNEETIGEIADLTYHVMVLMALQGIRPEDIHVEESYLKVSEAANIKTDVDMTELMGSEIYLYLLANEQKLTARVPAHVGVRAGDNIRVAFDTEKIHVFDKETEKVICQ